MHKVSQEMQNTIAQHHQRKKSRLKPSVTQRAIRARFLRYSDDARNRRASEPILFSAAEAPFTGKTQCFAVESQWGANILTSEAQIKAKQNTPSKNTRRYVEWWLNWMMETMKLKRQLNQARTGARWWAPCTRPRPRATTLVDYQYVPHKEVPEVSKIGNL